MFLTWYIFKQTHLKHDFHTKMINFYVKLANIVVFGQNVVK